jgi:hypothetical protein
VSPVFTSLAASAAEMTFMIAFTNE